MIVPEPDRAHIRRAAAGRGLDLEDLQEETRSATWLVTVVVDGDGGVSLDDLAALATDLDPLAEAWGGPEQAVTLEITSRGVDAPLTGPRHWRRARARLVELTYVTGERGPDVARVGDVDEVAGTVRLVSRVGRAYRTDSVALDQVDSAVIRVEFRPAPEGELALLADPDVPGRGEREGD